MTSPGTIDEPIEYQTKKRGTPLMTTEIEGH